MEDGELEKVTNHYIKQLKGSGYTRKECREIVVSGALGWKRRMARRLEENKEFYRSAESTLKNRIKKKLLDPVRWYKAKVPEIVDKEGKKEYKEYKGEVEEKMIKRGLKRKAANKDGEDDRETRPWGILNSTDPQNGLPQKPTPDLATRDYTSLIGKPMLPPYWSLGFHLSRWGYDSLESMQAAINRTKDCHIPQVRPEFMPLFFVIRCNSSPSPRD